MGLFSKPAFGLDISDLNIQILHLNKNKEEICRYYGDIDSGAIENGRIIDENKIIDSIKGAMKKCRPKPPAIKEVVASLPDSQLFTHVSEIKEPVKSKNFEKLLQEDVRQNMPLDLSDLYADYQVFHPNTEKQQVFFTAAVKEMVDAYTQALKKSGLEPIALDMESGCLGRCLLPDDFKNGNIMIVDIGARNTIISIFKKEGMIFSLNIPIAGNQFSRAVSEELGISLREAEKLKIKHGISGHKSDKGAGKLIKNELDEIISEIKKCNQFHQYKVGGDIKTIFLTGGSSKMKGLVDYISKEIKADVSIGNTKKRTMSTVYGLALRGIAKHPKTDGINLLPPS